MAGGVAAKGSALVATARAKMTAAQIALDTAAARGMVDGGTENATFLAASVDPAVAAAVTALQAIQ